MARADSCEPSKLEATGTEIPEVVVVLAVDDGCACATEVDCVKRGVGRLKEDTVVVVEVVESSAGECVGGRGGTEDKVVCEDTGGSEVGVVMASPSPPRVSSEIGKTNEAGSRLTQEDGGMFWSGSGGGGGS